jgi:hypothetical protein
MKRDEQAMLAPAGGVLVVVLACESLDGIGKLRCERRAIGCRREANLRVDPERGEPPVRAPGAADQLAELPDLPRGEREQPQRRELVGRAFRSPWRSSARRW